MAHTPGPWTWTGVFVEDATGTPVAAVYDSSTRSEESYAANATLIAAAPDLRAALLEAVQSDELAWRMEPGILQRALAALNQSGPARK